MHVAVCIVGFRNVDDVAECLGALSLSEHSDFEVVICENGGAVAADALRARLPERLGGGQPVRLEEAPDNLGYAGGVNLCIGLTPAADAWWVLNPDTVPDRRALTHLCALLLSGEYAAVGGTLHNGLGIVESRGGRWRPWLARAVSVGHGVPIGDEHRLEGSLQDLSYLSGASMLIGRRFVEQVGLMREDYFLYAEEVEWCVRAVQAGLRLGVAPDALVMHKQGTTTGAVRDVRSRGRMPVYLDERNKLLLTRDRYPHCLPVAAPAALALIFLRFARRRAWRQLGYALAGWWAGVRGLRGRPSWVGS